MPLLVLDDGTKIQGSKKIISWAQANPAGAAAPGGGRARSGRLSRAGAERRRGLSGGKA